MEFSHSILQNRHTTATEEQTIDLPVNPLSHILISMDGYNVTDEATLAEILAFVNTIKVTHRGQTIIDMDSEMLYALNCYLYGGVPIVTQAIATDNAHRSIGLIVPFGRRLYDPAECYPSTKKGELQLVVNTTVPSASLDNSQLTIEAVELFGASPSAHLKAAMKTVAAPGATGDNEVELPIGNQILALILRMTTFPATSSHTYGVDYLTVKVDNKEYGYSKTSAEGLVAALANRRKYSQNTIAAYGDIQPDNVVWADYDPDGLGTFALDTAGKSRVHAVLNMGVDEATYLLPVELVSAGGGAA